MKNPNLFGIIPSQELMGDRFAWVVQGPGGTGKSTALGTMAELYKTLLIATLSREAASWKYRELNVDTVPLWESGWTGDDEGRIPPGLKLEAQAKFMRLMDELAADDVYDAVIVDSGTELGEIFWHGAMMPHGVIGPAFMTDNRSRWLPFDTLGTNLDQAIKKLTNLASGKNVVRPKFVGVSWHIQPPKDDTVETGTAGEGKVKKVSADHVGEGVEYEGKVLPMIRGGFRRKLTSQFDAVVFTDILYEAVTTGMTTKKVPRYVLQVQPDAERHAKIPGRMASVKYINNTFKELYDLVKEGRTAADVAASASASPAERPSLRRTPPTPQGAK